MEGLQVLNEDAEEMLNLIILAHMNALLPICIKQYFNVIFAPKGYKCSLACKTLHSVYSGT